MNMFRYQILDYFKYEHLPEHLRPISKAFAILANEMAERKPGGDAETSAGLRKLLEAKDCAVRAMV